MNAATERRLTLPLTIGVLLLGVVSLALLGGLGRGVHWDPPREAVAETAHQAPAKLPPPVSLQHYAEVWQKPLFSPDRKPTARAAGTASNIGDLELTGIIITPDLRMALLRNTTNHEEIRVREGATLPDGGTSLVELRPRSAVFDASSGRVELKLPSGAPIDARRDAATPPADQRGASPMSVGDQPEAQPRGLPVEPVEPNADDESDDGDGDRATGHSMLPAPRRMGLQPPDPAAAGSSRDNQQAERIRRLREAIQKRRAEQAAPAAHEGDR